MPNPFFENPRTRRLRRDLAEMRELAGQSSIMTFEAKGDAPTGYTVRFRGKGLARDSEISENHEVQIQMVGEYPRSMPAITFLSPIYHPNIAGGRPCFGTFVMSPSVRLVDIVEMIWDMIRLSTYNPYGGYGDKERWQVLRRQMGFPVDDRILRDKVEREPREEDAGDDPPLVIMGGISMGAMSTSQVWVKAALEQFFESRGLAGEVEVFTGDDWYSESGEAVPGLIAVLRPAEGFPESQDLDEDLARRQGRLFRRGVPVFGKRIGMAETNWFKEAEQDAKSGVLDVVDVIIKDIIDNEGSTDKGINDFVDEFRHTYSDQSYSLIEAAQVLDALSDYEETDSGIWEGLEPRDAVKAQAAYTYGNAVYGIADEILNTIWAEITEEDGRSLFFDKDEWLKAGPWKKSVFDWNPEADEDKDDEALEELHRKHVQETVKKIVEDTINNW
jgi:ubiquitin-protein ligase